MPYTTIVTEGGLLPADILDQIAAGEIEGQRPEDFGLPRTRRVLDEIAAAWGDARAHWDSFQHSLRRLPPADPATSITRERWVRPLLEALGYSDLTYTPRAAVLNGRTYSISHRAGQDETAPPVHIEGLRTSLDKRAESGRPRLSPHALLQEYLNDDEDHLWGLVTNGERLRLLRDSAQMTRPRYVEFDLQGMLTGERFTDFVLLYRLLHRSRLPRPGEDGAQARLERYFQMAVEAGGRVRERLRDGVEAALLALGNGLLSHPASAPLRRRLASGELTPMALYQQLLRLVYRLLFLMVAEERDLIAVEDDVADPLSPQAYRLPRDERLAVYREHYSVARLRRLAEARGVGRGPYDDLWLGLVQTFGMFESQDPHPRALGLMPLDGGLFSRDALADLLDARLRNADLLAAVRALSLYRDKASQVERRVNYGALDVEELGSVYESLLDYRPIVTPAGPDTTDLQFDLVSGAERKTTGSYYTRPELVHELVKSALEPVIEERLKAATDEGRRKKEEDRAARSGSPSVLRLSSAGVDPREAALLGLTVCDPACGSGHFLLAAARRIGRELARVRSGEDQPTPDVFRRAVRDVIAHCIYGVDLNPLAVDLCKLALWIEGYSAGLPLSFLDHHIKLGNSLVGTTARLVKAGIPDDAFKPVTGDDKTAAAALRKRNKAEREAFEAGQMSLPLQYAHKTGAELAVEARGLDAIAEDSVAAVRAKADQYDRLRRDAAPQMTLYNLWTAAFFLPLTRADDPTLPTTGALLDYQAGRPLDPRLVARAAALAQELHFFHWGLEFPQVFSRGDGGRKTADGRAAPGFDVVLGNPPWERIKLQEEEHWVDVPSISQAANKAERERRIQAWRAGTPQQRARVAQFDFARHAAEATSRFVRASGRLPLTAVGDVNTYALFAELDRSLVNATGRAGIIVPTGIATDDTNKGFFADLNAKRQLVSLYDFENREKLFQEVDSRMKFCLLTVGATREPTRYAFFATNTAHLDDAQRVFALSAEDIALLNPNTRTVPVFRTRADAELTKAIYRRVPVLVNEATGENPWGVTFRQGLFNMSSDSGLFQSAPGPGLLPLYEAKLLHQFTHRWATYEGGDSRDMTPAELADPACAVTPRYWVAATEVEERLRGRWERNWLLGFRDIARSTDERTAIFSLLPRVGVGHTAPLMFAPEFARPTLALCFLATMNSMTLDYVARQKVGGTHLTYTYLNQFPVLPPDAFSPADVAFISERVLELVYTAWDMQPFAADVWAELDAAGRERVLRRWREADGGRKTEDGGRRTADGPPPPFRWDEGRRAAVRAELDARIARLYGLTRDELRYILDPADVYGPDFPGETFRVLKEKEVKQYGEYRTRRLVLEAWERGGRELTSDD